MSDRPSGKWWRRVGRVALILGAIVFYVLSAGPMAWLESHDWIPSPVMDVYAPLWYLPVKHHPWDWAFRWEMWWRNR